MEKLKLEVKKLESRETKTAHGCAPTCPIEGGAGCVWDGLLLDMSISLCM